MSITLDVPKYIISADGAPMFCVEGYLNPPELSVGAVAVSTRVCPRTGYTSHSSGWTWEANIK